MATANAAGAIKYGAENRVLEFLEKHGRSGAVEDLETVGTGTPRDAWHLAAAQATMMAGLAEIIEDQAQREEERDQRIEEQGRRITALEEAAKPAASTKKPAKKS